MCVQVDLHRVFVTYNVVDYVIAVVYGLIWGYLLVCTREFGGRYGNAPILALFVAKPVFNAYVIRYTK